MKRILPILFTLVLSLLAVSCEKGTPEPVFELGSDKLVFEADAKVDQSVDVTSEGVEWKVEVDHLVADWITATKNDNKVAISVKANTSMQERVGVVNVIPTTNADKFNALAITVTQKGSDVPPVYDVIVNPTSMTFASEGGIEQQITVTTTGEGLTWSAAAEDAVKSWLKVETVDGKVNVKAIDNIYEKKREGKVVITTNQPSVSKKIVYVTQEAKVIPPSLSIDNPGPITFDAEVASSAKVTIKVTAVNTNWDVSVDYLEGPKDWVKINKVLNEIESSVVFISHKNEEPAERSCVIVITPDAEGLKPIRITVSQNAFVAYLSDLTADVALAEGLTNHETLIWPVSKTANDSIVTTLWTLKLLGKGMTWKTTAPYVTGQGDRIDVRLRSTRIEFNAEKEYYLPEGDYTVTSDWPSSNRKAVPNVVQAGLNSTLWAFPSGSWYFKMDGGTYINKGNFAGGKINVKRKGFIYTITFDLLDDRGFKIQGTFEDELNIKQVGQDLGPDVTVGQDDDNFGEPAKPEI